MEYIDLHVHTEYTKGNGLSRIPELIKKAKEYKMDSLAITDSGNIDGFREFGQCCKEFDIKPIYGCGFYFAPFGFSLKETQHLVLIAKNIDGIKNIEKLVQLSNSNIIGNKPRIDISLVRQYNNGIICLTGGLGGVFDKPYIAGNCNAAIENIRDLKDIFNNDIYFELQNNGLELNRLMIPEIIKVSKSMAIPCVVTGGSFYINRTDARACNTLRIKYNNRELEGDGFYFKSKDDIHKSFQGYEEYINNSVVINKRISYKL